MALLSPILSPRKERRFGVFDLEWVPGEKLPLPTATRVKVDGITDDCKMPLPSGDVMTKPLKPRIAGYYEIDQDDEEEREVDGEVVKNYRYSCFTTIEDLLGHLLVRQRRGMWFYAHAGGLADMQFVLDFIFRQIKGEFGPTKSTTSQATEAEQALGADLSTEFSSGSYKVRASFSGSSAIIVHISKGKNAWHFVDSYWLLRDKLSNIGKAIKVKKGDSQLSLDFLKGRFGKESFDDLTNDERTKFYADAPIDVLISYNQTDCEILWKAIKQFEDEIQDLGGQLQQTIASTGMNLFRRVYLKRTINTSEKVNKIAEESYFASRVEVLSRYASDFNDYDINSSFPYSMTFAQPAGLLGVSTKLPERDDDECIYLADVTIEVPDLDFPPLPYRKDGRVFFPVGRWRSWFTSVDIRLALKHGAILHKVHEVYTFDPFYDLKGYADDIYAKRAAATSAFRKLVLKYLLNSLYGKYAESLCKQEMLINPEEIDRSTFQMLQPGIWLRDKMTTIAHRHVPISTHITAIARRTLYEYGVMCYDQGCPVYYVDTDSIKSKAILPVDDKKLGMMKLEKKSKETQFVAPKIYFGEGWNIKKDGTVEENLEYTAKAKGFSLDRILVDGIDNEHPRAAYDKLARIVAGDRVAVQRMVRLRELYRLRDSTGYLSSPVESLVIKALTFEMLTKRFQYPDGETRPWSVSELRSGDIYPRGFDFEPEIMSRLDTTTRAMMEAAV